MKKTKNFRFLYSILVLLWMIGLGQTVLAAPQESPAGEISLPVTIREEGAVPETPEVYTLVLEGEEGAPMPEGSQGQRFQWQVTGAQTTAFPTIVCNGVGIYHYTVTQEPGENAYCTYDQVKYQVVVTITYPEEGESLDVSVVITPDGSSVKADTALFVNSYKAPPVEIPQTGETVPLPLLLLLCAFSLLAAGYLWKQKKTA